jgi:predicted molibdopterin-dependent oxidoreductase YjgC
MCLPIRVIQSILRILINYDLKYIDFVDHRQDCYDEYLRSIEIGTYSYEDDNLGLIPVSDTLILELLSSNISSNKFYSLIIQDVKEPATDW